MLRNHRRGAIAGAMVSVFFLLTPWRACAEETEPSCEDRLTKKARLIYDGVVEKKQANSDLNELWKEITRDLITKNAIGREEATAAANQAMSCLKKD